MQRVAVNSIIKTLSYTSYCSSKYCKRTYFIAVIGFVLIVLQARVELSKKYPFNGKTYLQLEGHLQNNCKLREYIISTNRYLIE